MDRDIERGKDSETDRDTERDMDCDIELGRETDMDLRFFAILR
jgi:hypothetical protein